MEGTLIFIIIICIVLLFSKLSGLADEIRFLQSKIENNKKENDILKNELESIKKQFSFKNPIIENAIEHVVEKEIEKEIIPPVLRAETIVEKQIIAETEIVNPSAKVETVQFSHQKSEITIEAKKIPQAALKEPSQVSIIIKKIEQQLAENWTGILGTAIMVLGIGYLSIYTALKVTPIYRVLILWFYAFLLMAGNQLLYKKDKWIQTGLWLRSAGAALFLFGCFGASQIPALSFIKNQNFGFLLIGLGIGLNLYIGYIIKRSSFLSLHVVFGVLVLCAIPNKSIATLIMAALTSLIGIILSLKEKWEYHLLIVILAFLGFDVWFNINNDLLSVFENTVAIAAIILVAVSCMFMQYRNIYQNTYFDKPAFVTHLTNWILFAIGLILHSTGSRFKIFVLFAGAILCFFMALSARKRKVYWLYHLDGLVAFILCFLSIILLNNWNVGLDIVMCILYALTVFCLFVVYYQKELLLHKILLAFNHVFGFGLIIFSMLLIANSLANYNITSSVLSLATLAITSIFISVFSAVKQEFGAADLFIGTKLNLNALLSIVFFSFLILNCKLIYGNSFYYLLISVALFWCFLRHKFESVSFEIGKIVFLIASIFIGVIVIGSQFKSILDLWFTLLLLVLIASNWLTNRFEKVGTLIQVVSILGVNAIFCVLSYKYLANNALLQICSMFLIALCNHEFLWYHFKRKSLNSYIQELVYYLYYLFIILGTAQLVLQIKSIETIKIAGIFIIISLIEAYALFAEKIKKLDDGTAVSWSRFSKFNCEFLLLNALLFGLYCIKIEYLSLYFIVLAVIKFLLFTKFEEFKVYKIYSVVMVVLAMVLSVFVAVNTIATAQTNILYTCQIISILLAGVYTFLWLRSNIKNSSKIILFLVGLINFWIVILFFIQISITFLPTLIMLLAIGNFWFYFSNKQKIDGDFSASLAFLAITVSVIFCFYKFNDFVIIDWFLHSIAIVLGIVLIFLYKLKNMESAYMLQQQLILNIWLSVLMFSQLPQKWLPVYWIFVAILNLYLYQKKISLHKNISTVYYILANFHLAFLSFSYYQSNYLPIYLLIFALISIYIILAYKWLEDTQYKNSLLVYPATFSIGFFLFLIFNKGILTFFWILEALGLLILGIFLKEKYFRYVSLSLVGLCVIRLMFFDLSNSDFLIRALVLVGVGIVLIVMNSLFKKYKDRFD